MKRLSKEKLHYTLSPFHKPNLTIKPGETIIVETEDAFSGTIKTERDVRDKIKMPFSNPVTGPIYVEGAKRGDTLAIEIKEIRPTSGYGITYLEPGLDRLMGITAFTRLLHRQAPPRTKIYPIKNGKVYFSKELALPVEPMIGTIGTSPQIEALLSNMPGMHGGNMDCPDVCPGNTVFLPVFVKGALLFLGDVHAIQGEGEACGVAIETPAEIILTIDLIKNKRIDWPRIKSQDYIMTVCSAKPLEDAARTAYSELILWLEKEYGFSRLDACILVTQLSKASICQIVNPLYTVAARFPIEYLLKNNRF